MSDEALRLRLAAISAEHGRHVWDRADLDGLREEYREPVEAERPEPAVTLRSVRRDTRRT